MDPNSIVYKYVRRGVPVGAIVSMVISSVCLCGFLGLFLLFSGPIFIVAFILSMMTLVPMAAGILALDRLEPEPWYLLLTSFLWGAGTSVVISIIFSALGMAVMIVGFGDINVLVETAVIAPIVEESAKALVLFGLFWFRRSEFNGIADGVVYAATCAIGFAAAENIMYYINAASEGTMSLAMSFVIRGMLSPFIHPVFTSMTGIGLALAVRERSIEARIALPVGGLLMAMILHALWNGSLLFSVIAFFVAFLSIVGVLIGILMAVYYDRKRTISRIQACMFRYVPTGLVTNADLAMLSSVKTRKEARKWAQARAGKGGFNAMRDYQQACTELTILHDRAQIGIVPAQQFEAHRYALLAFMQRAREAFLGTNYYAAPMMNQSMQAPPRY